MEAANVHAQQSNLHGICMTSKKQVTTDCQPSNRICKVFKQTASIFTTVFPYSFRNYAYVYYKKNNQKYNKDVKFLTGSRR